MTTSSALIGPTLARTTSCPATKRLISPEEDMWLTAQPITQKRRTIRATKPAIHLATRHTRQFACCFVLWTFGFTSVPSMLSINQRSYRTQARQRAVAPISNPELPPSIPIVSAISTQQPMPVKRRIVLSKTRKYLLAILLRLAELTSNTRDCIWNFQPSPSKATSSIESNCIAS